MLQNIWLIAVVPEKVGKDIFGVNICNAGITIERGESELLGSDDVANEIGRKSFNIDVEGCGVGLVLSRGRISGDRGK